MIKNISLCVVFGFAISYVSVLLESDYILVFSRSSLLTLLIALFAVQISTVSFVLSKIKTIQTNVEANFDRTIDEIEKAFFEQVCVIVVTVLLLIIATSKVLIKGMPNHEIVVGGMLCSACVYEMLILLDTAKAVFEIAKVKLPPKKGD